MATAGGGAVLQLDSHHRHLERQVSKLAGTVEDVVEGLRILGTVTGQRDLRDFGEKIDKLRDELKEAKAVAQTRPDDGKDRPELS